jgi:RNA polymerase sigma-70 factor (ECF subfamily)
MPPLPTWFRGKDAIAAFITARIFRTTWRFAVTTAGGQPAMIGRRRDAEGGRYEVRALTVFTFEGERIAAMTAFLGPGVLGRFSAGEIPLPHR